MTKVALNQRLHKRNKEESLICKMKQGGNDLGKDEFVCLKNYSFECFCAVATFMVIRKPYSFL